MDQGDHITTSAADNVRPTPPWDVVYEAPRAPRSRSRKRIDRPTRITPPAWSAHLGELQDEHGFSERAAAWCAEHHYRTLGQLRDAAVKGKLRQHPHRDGVVTVEVEALVFHAMAAHAYLASCFEGQPSKHDLWADVLKLPRCTLAEREGHIATCVADYTTRRQSINTFLAASNHLKTHLSQQGRSALRALFSRYQPGSMRDQQVLLSAPMDALVRRASLPVIKELKVWQRHMRAHLLPAPAPDPTRPEPPPIATAERTRLLHKACAPLSLRALNGLFRLLRLFEDEQDISSMLDPAFELIKCRGVGVTTRMELEEWRQCMLNDPYLRNMGGLADPAWEGVFDRRFTGHNAAGGWA